jgi:hypothetical protein
MEHAIGGASISVPEGGVRRTVETEVIHQPTRTAAPRHEDVWV